MRQKALSDEGREISPSSLLGYIIGVSGFGRGVHRRDPTTRSKARDRPRPRLRGSSVPGAHGRRVGHNDKACAGECGARREIVGLCSASIGPPSLRTVVCVPRQHITTNAHGRRGRELTRGRARMDVVLAEPYPALTTAAPAPSIFTGDVAFGVCAHVRMHMCARVCICLT